jgi:hypothetical protein
MDANRLLAIASKSKYLRAIDIEEPTLFTIENTTIDTLKVRNQEQERGVVWFREDDRGLVLNVSLTEILMDMFGSETDAWKGKRIRLYNDHRVKFRGEAVGGIRIKSSPDIDQDLTIHTGGNAYSADTEYKIRAERRFSSPLEEALVAEGLSLEAFDRWRVSTGKPIHAQMSVRDREAAATWVARGGHKVVRQHNAPPAPDDFDDPMAV